MSRPVTANTVWLRKIDGDVRRAHARIDVLGEEWPESVRGQYALSLWEAQRAIAQLSTRITELERMLSGAQAQQSESEQDKCN